MNVDEVRAAYPQLSAEDIRAALAYAAEVLRHEVIVPISGSLLPLNVKVDEDLPSQVAGLVRSASHPRTSGP